MEGERQKPPSAKLTCPGSDTAKPRAAPQRLLTPRLLSLHKAILLATLLCVPLRTFSFGGQKLRRFIKKGSRPAETLKE